MKKIKVLIEKSGCAMNGISFNPKTTHHIETKDGLLPPRWVGKAEVIEETTEKVSKKKEEKNV